MIMLMLRMMIWTMRVPAGSEVTNETMNETQPTFAGHKTMGRIVKGGDEGSTGWDGAEPHRMWGGAWRSQAPSTSAAALAKTCPSLPKLRLASLSFP